MKFPPQTLVSLPLTVARHPRDHRSVTSSQPSVGQVTSKASSFGRYVRTWTFATVAGGSLMMPVTTGASASHGRTGRGSRT
ncbi:hypothetical protein LCGC14_1976730, partial [marine sediment metagenome]